MQERPGTVVHWTAWTRLPNEVQVLALIRNTQLTADISLSKQWLHFNPLNHMKEKQWAGRQISENASAEDWNIFAYFRIKKNMCHKTAVHKTILKLHNQSF